MPTIAVNKAELYRRLEREYTTDEFDELCFDYGLELDEDTTKEVEEAKKKGLPAGEPELKIEVPANRYDLVCLEGIARALRIFLGLMDPPKYALSVPAVMQEVHVEASTAPLRPYFASAILRLARPLNQLEYESFIALQDKLHMNLCRQRRFVAIGTHDLDTIEGPFRYLCRDPNEIKFAPLNREVESTAAELMVSYEGDRHLGRYLHIIKDAPAYPIIYDAKDRVLSMPPIINSQHSRIIAGKTKNIFIDTTATDKTKLDIVINMVATMFAEYCEVPFVIEPVKVHMPDGTSFISPPLAPRATTASSSYMNAATGLSLSREEQAKLLTRMSLIARPSTSDPDALELEIPCTRPDILHECDCMEDLAVSYGFNKLPKQMPRTNTVAKAFGLNKLADIIRKECAMAGWIECLPLILCSHDENFAHLNRPDPGNYAVSLANPASQEYQVVRTSLLPGLLKTARENKSLPLPMKIFEVSDVAVQDPREERQARNYRRLAGLYMNKSASFESTHGLLDRVMQILGVPFLQTKESKAEYGYWIEAADDPTYLPGRGARVLYRPKPSVSSEELAEPTPSSAPTGSSSSSAAVETSESSSGEKTKSGPLHTLAQNLKAALPGHHHKHADASEDKKAQESPVSSVVSAVKGAISSTGSRDMVIGSLGILHPSVLGHFELARPCSCMEIDVEPLL